MINAALMERAASLVSFDRPVSEIRQSLLSSGLLEHEAYLAFKAGQMMERWRQEEAERFVDASCEGAV